MLVRKFVNASFRLLLRADWDAEIISSYNDIMTRKGGPLWYVFLEAHLKLVFIRLLQPGR